MRAPLLLSSFLLATIAGAQANANDAQVASAMRPLRSGNPLILEMTGKTVSGSRTTPFYAVLYWKTSTDPSTGKAARPQIELDVYDKGPTAPITLRIVGDGTTLRRYDIVGREVVSTVYGASGTSASKLSDVARALAQLRTATPGPAAYLARLVSDLAPGEPDATYVTWMPGVPARSLLEIPLTDVGGRRDDRVEEVPDDDEVVEPLAGVKYVQGATGWTTYGLDAPNPRRTLAFEFEPSADGSGTTIKNVYYADRSVGRTLSFVISPKVAVLPSDVPAWAFQPYTGAQGAAFRPLARPGAGS